MPVEKYRRTFCTQNIYKQIFALSLALFDARTAMFHTVIVFNWIQTLGSSYNTISVLEMII